MPERSWLHQHTSTVTATTTTTWSQRSAHSSNSNNHKQQVMTTRLFLAEFVDLHRLFFVCQGIHDALQNHGTCAMPSCANSFASKPFSEHIVSSTNATSSSQTTTNICSHQRTPLGTRDDLTFLCHSVTRRLILRPLMAAMDEIQTTRRQ